MTNRLTKQKTTKEKPDGRMADEKCTSPMKSKVRPTVCSDYAEGLTAMVFGKRLLLFSSKYILEKHGQDGEVIGSKLGEIKSGSDIVKFLEANVDEDILSGVEGRLKMPSIPTGKTVDTDALVEIVSLRTGNNEVTIGGELEKGYEYQAVVRDADGNEFEATVKYEIVREDEGQDPTYQPIAYSRTSQPTTDKVNVVMGETDLNDKRAAWLEPDNLREALSEVGISEMDIEGVYVIFTIFPGTYAPMANEPFSSQLDPLVGVTGNDFWKSHALMRMERLDGGKSYDEESKDTQGIMSTKPKDCNSMDLTQSSDAVKVYKKPVVLGFEYAENDSTIETKEGPVKCSKGDAILTGTQGERWPVPRDRFAETYDVVGDGECAKKKIEVLALQMDEAFTVKPSWSNDPLVGKPGDWFVQYGKGDYGVVDCEIFEETYSRC